jgi:hypothetical protein
MDMGSFLFVLIALVIVATFSVLAACAEEEMRGECARRPCCQHLQQQITMGKARCR